MQAFQNALYHYKATVLRHVDGDTILADLSLGCRVNTVRMIRLLGFNAPELFSGSDRAEGMEAKAVLEGIIPVGCTVYLATRLDRTSFDRLLAHVHVEGSDGNLYDVSEAMVSGGFGEKA